MEPSGAPTRGSGCCSRQGDRHRRARLPAAAHARRLGRGRDGDFTTGRPRRGAGGGPCAAAAHGQGHRGGTGLPVRRGRQVAFRHCEPLHGDRLRRRQLFMFLDVDDACWCSTPPSSEWESGRPGVGRRRQLEAKVDGGELDGPGPALSGEAGLRTRLLSGLGNEHAGGLCRRRAGPCRGRGGQARLRFGRPLRHRPVRRQPRAVRIRLCVQPAAARHDRAGSAARDRDQGRRRLHEGRRLPAARFRARRVRGRVRVHAVRLFAEDHRGTDHQGAERGGPLRAAGDGLCPLAWGPAAPAGLQAECGGRDDRHQPSFRLSDFGRCAPQRRPGRHPVSPRSGRRRPPHPLFPARHLPDRGRRADSRDHGRAWLGIGLYLHIAARRRAAPRRHEPDLLSRR